MDFKRSEPLVLTNAEYNVLNSIASQTKMDCWFYLDQYTSGEDFVRDIENSDILTLYEGISQLNEGIVWELLDLTAEEIAVYKNLLKELGIEEVM